MRFWDIRFFVAIERCLLFIFKSFEQSLFIFDDIFHTCIFLRLHKDGLTGFSLFFYLFWFITIKLLFNFINLLMIPLFILLRSKALELILFELIHPIGFKEKIQGLCCFFTDCVLILLVFFGDCLIEFFKSSLFQFLFQCIFDMNWLRSLGIQ